jgi:hypothetical protein
VYNYIGRADGYIYSYSFDTHTYPTDCHLYTGSPNTDAHPTDADVSPGNGHPYSCSTDSFPYPCSTNSHTHRQGDFWPSHIL